MTRLRVSDEAQADLEQIVSYLADANPRAAARWVDLVERSFGLLLMAPDTGRVRDELRPGLRSVVVGKYVIFYRHQDDVIEIARVIHGHRDLESIFWD